MTNKIFPQLITNQWYSLITLICVLAQSLSLQSQPYMRIKLCPKCTTWDSILYLVNTSETWAFVGRILDFQSPSLQGWVLVLKISFLWLLRLTTTRQFSWDWLETPRLPPETWQSSEEAWSRPPSLRDWAWSWKRVSQQGRVLQPSPWSQGLGLVSI